MKLNPESKENLRRISKAQGMRQVAIVNRMVDWLSRQDRTTRAIAMGQIAEPQREKQNLLLVALAETGNAERYAGVLLSALVTAETCRSESIPSGIAGRIGPGGRAA